MIDYKNKKEALVRWVKANRNIAIALPVALGLCSFFVIENVKDLSAGETRADKGDAFDTTLPGKDPELKEVDNNELWFKKEDAFVNGTGDGAPGLMVPDTKADSVDAIVERLESMSMEPIENPSSTGSLSPGTVGGNGQGGKVVSETERKQRSAEQKMAYREMLRKGKEEIVGTGRSTSPSNTIGTQEAAAGDGIAFRAVVYKDQFVMPNDVAKLILTRDVVLDGNIFKKNTIVFGTVSIQGNRVHFKIDNINHVPVELVVKDYNDGMEGLYSQRAGELWDEFRSETQSSVLNDGINEVGGTSRVIRGVANEVGNFFRSRKYRERDKVLLVNDRELLMVAK